MAKVSVIIPCYNQGAFLEEAVASVLSQTSSDFEIIIINDGSTDPVSKKILNESSWPYTRVIHTDNQGLAAARNNGIVEASGKYILPLDADDVIEPTYIEKATDLLDNDPDLGIVYCKARLFGAVTTEWTLPPYSLDSMLQDNVIFCSAMFRREDWETVGGYDTGMVYGWEDYEFWVSLIESGRKVYQIPEVLFGYRVTADSMVRSKEKGQKISMFKRVFHRHQQFYSDNIEVWLRTILDAREPYYTSRLYIECGEGISDESSLSRKVDLSTTQIRFDLQGINNIKKIRFDPVDVPAVLHIYSIILEYKDGRSEEVKSWEHNALLIDEHNDSYFDHDDPQCILHVKASELQNIFYLSVILNFKALGEQALSRLVDEQKKIIKKNAQLGTFKALLKALKRQPSENIRTFIRRQLGW